MKKLWLESWGFVVAGIIFLLIGWVIADAIKFKVSEQKRMDSFRFEVCTVGWEHTCFYGNSVKSDNNNFCIQLDGKDYICGQFTVKDRGEAH